MYFTFLAEFRWSQGRKFRTFQLTCVIFLTSFAKLGWHKGKKFRTCPLTYVTWGSEIPKVLAYLCNLFHTFLKFGWHRVGNSEPFKEGLQNQLTMFEVKFGNSELFSLSKKYVFFIKIYALCKYRKICILFGNIFIKKYKSAKVWLSCTRVFESKSALPA